MYNPNAKGGVLQGIVKNKLGQDGYPILQNEHNWDRRDWNPESNESLRYLFSDRTDGVVEGTDNANYLFQRDADGYYYYDSAINRAYLNGNQFTIYNQPDESGDKTYFDPFDDGSQGGLNNSHFGMEISTQFLMPKDGKVNGQDMVFEFSGDDDVWVFVDDVLVLDMGGIHGKCTGTINFQTGNVTIDMVNTGKKGESKSYTATLDDLFQL